MATRTRLQGKQGSTSQLTAEEEDTLFKLRFQDALDDEQVAVKLAQIIRSGNQDLLDSIGSLRNEVKSLRAQLMDRDAKIASLHVEVQKLREDNDALEQYGRRNNLRISGLPEPRLEEGQAEDTTGMIVDLANDILKLDPLLQTTDIEVSHRLKQRRNAKEGEPRPVIVRFRSKQERFRFISNRKNLKAHNDDQDNPFKIYVNEDLTYMRAKLFSTVRLLHKRKYFSQVWTYSGGIRVKDLQGTVKTIANTGDIQKLLPDIDLSSIM